MEKKYQMRDGGASSKEKSKKPMIAGVLMIIAFGLAVLGAGEIFILDIEEIEDEFEDEEIGQDLIDTVTNLCGILFLVFGVVLLVGGVFAIKRTRWKVALGASIVGIFSIGPLFMATLFSFIALVLIFLSKDEFGKKGNANVLATFGDGNSS